MWDRLSSRAWSAALPWACALRNPRSSREIGARRLRLTVCWPSPVIVSYVVVVVNPGAETEIS